MYEIYCDSFDKHIVSWKKIFYGRLRCFEWKIKENNMVQKNITNVPEWMKSDLSIEEMYSKAVAEAESLCFSWLLPDFRGDLRH